METKEEIETTLNYNFKDIMFEARQEIRGTLIKSQGTSLLLFPKNKMNY